MILGFDLTAIYINILLSSSDYTSPPKKYTNTMGRGPGRPRKVYKTEEDRLEVEREIRRRSYHK